MIYTYLIVYSNITGIVSGFGRLELVRNRKIKSIDDIKSIEELIMEQYGYSHVIVTNYILLSKKIGRIK